MAMYVSLKPPEQAAIVAPLRSLPKLVRAVPQLTISPAILVGLMRPIGRAGAAIDALCGVGLLGLVAKRGPWR